MAVRALRGATTIDDDTPEQIRDRVKALMTALVERNELVNDDIVSVFVTATGDIHSMHPATAARELGLDDVAFLGAQEATIDGTLPRCVRLLLLIETSRPRSELQHVFLEGARGLRPDLVGDD